MKNHEKVQKRHSPNKGGWEASHRWWKVQQQGFVSDEEIADEVWKVTGKHVINKHHKVEEVLSDR